MQGVQYKKCIRDDNQNARNNLCRFKAQLQLRRDLDLVRIRGQHLRGIVDHLVDDGLCREDLVNESRDTADEPWAGGGTRALGVLLHLVLIWQDTLRRELLDLSLAVVVPEKIVSLTRSA